MKVFAHRISCTDFSDLTPADNAGYQIDLITLMFPENYGKNYTLKVEMVESRALLLCNQTVSIFNALITLLRSLTISRKDLLTTLSL